MDAALFLAKRLSLRNGDDGRRKSSTGIFIAVIGISLSLVIMMISIAVVTGFKREIRQKVTGFSSQITITPDLSFDYRAVNKGIQLTDSMRSVIGVVLPEASLELTLSQPGILKTEDSFQGLIIKGVESTDSNRFISSNIIEGSYPDYSRSDAANDIMISSITASKLGLHPGDKVMAHFFQNNSVRSRRFRIAAVYDTHFSDFDKLYAFSDINVLQRLNGVDSITGTALEVNGLDESLVEDLSDSLRVALWESQKDNVRPSIYRVSNVNESGAVYFNWLDLLDTNVVVILILMALVSGFTLISSLFIIVLERVRTIGLLKALGASDAFIRRIFILIAERLVLAGVLIGNAVGLSILFLQEKLRFIPLDPDAYYLNYVPVSIDWVNILILNAAVIVMSFAVLLGPSRLVSSLSPSESMRYE